MATHKASSEASDPPSSLTPSTPKSETAPTYNNSSPYAIHLLSQFLEDTDYGAYLLTENPNMSVSLLRSKLKKKLAD